jgi:hypothetical protein
MNIQFHLLRLTTTLPQVSLKSQPTYKKAAMGAGAAISEARRPSMPLDVLASIIREALSGRFSRRF